MCFLGFGSPLSKSHRGPSGRSDRPADRPAIHRLGEYPGHSTATLQQLSDKMRSRQPVSRSARCISKRGPRPRSSVGDWSQASIRIPGRPAELRSGFHWPMTNTGGRPRGRSLVGLLIVERRVSGSEDDRAGSARSPSPLRATDASPHPTARRLAAGSSDR